MSSELFAKSVELMAVGMGMTFSFLILLVLMLNVLKWGVSLLNKICPEKVEVAKTPVLVTQNNKKLKIAIALAAIKAAK